MVCRRTWPRRLLRDDSEEKGNIEPTLSSVNRVTPKPPRAYPARPPGGFTAGRAEAMSL